MDNRVLVTGGAGFIGSSLVKHLCKMGYHLRVLDSLVGGTSIHDESSIGLIKGDVRDEAAVREAVDGVDYVIHLAALIDVTESFEKSALYREVNADGTRNLLRQSALAHVKRFVFASSCVVYGEPTELPVRETHQTTPLSPYGSSKLEAERICTSYANTNGLSPIVLRLFNVFGPRTISNAYSDVITEFIRRAIDNEPLTIFGDGNQTRDFIFIDDVVEYFARAVSGTATGVYNIGSGVPVSVNQIAALACRLTRSPESRIVHAEARLGEIKQIYADISRAKDELGYEPLIGFREGLARIVKHSLTTRMENVRVDNNP